MKRRVAASVALMGSLASSAIGHTQNPIPSTPTTRILAIGTINPGVDQAKVMEILPREVH